MNQIKVLKCNEYRVIRNIGPEISPIMSAMVYRCEEISVEVKAQDKE